MTERFKLSLSGMWLLVSLFALLFPIFLPSVADSANPAANVIGTATASMFILSFPSSLFGIPVLAISGYFLGVDPNSMQGMYLNLFLLFVLGLIQWFWIVPRVWRNEPRVQILDLTSPKDVIELPAMRSEFESFSSQDDTPLERVFREKDGSQN